MSGQIQVLSLIYYALLDIHVTSGQLQRANIMFFARLDLDVPQGPGLLKGTDLDVSLAFIAPPGLFLVRQKRASAL